MKTIGILGGMGPLATAYTMALLLNNASVEREQDYPDIIVSSKASLPDRPSFLNGKGPDPYPFMLEELKHLERSGAQIIIMPCNTAHFWHDRLSSDVPNVSFLHMVDLTIDHIHKHYGDKTVGILATKNTIEHGLYTGGFQKYGIDYIVPGPSEQIQIMKAIYLIKVGKLYEAYLTLRVEVDKLQARGAQVLLLGCTELPLVLDERSVSGMSVINPLECVTGYALRLAGCRGYRGWRRPMRVPNNNMHRTLYSLHF